MSATDQFFAKGRIGRELSGETVSASITDRHVRLLTAGLLCLYLAFVIYGSLVPLRFVFRPFDDALSAFWKIPFLELGIESRADWVANLLLFIPLAFLAAQVFIGARASGWRIGARLLIFFVLTSTAIAIEFVQLYFPQRTVSQNDILAESLGAAVGLFIQARWGAGAALFLASIWGRESRRRRVVRLLEAYLGILLLFNVMPLDLTISPVELFHKWNEGRVNLIPFGWTKGGFSAVLYGTLTDCLVWIPVGVLWALVTKRKLQVVIARGVAAALVIELLQLFVYSRVTDVTDVLLAGLGTALGGWLARQRWIELGMIGNVPASAWMTLWFFWVLMVLAVFWFPFNFDPDLGSLISARDALTRVPFSTYYFTSEYHATNELLRKVGFFIPGGLLLGLAINAAKRSVLKVPSIFLILLIPVLIETGQLFLPAKVSDLTDAFLEIVGVILGMLMVKWLCFEPGPATAYDSLGDRRDEEVSGILAVERPPSQAPRLAFAVHISQIVFLATGIWLISKMPVIPYNLRELIVVGPAGVWSALGVAIAGYAVLVVPVLLTRLLRGGRFILFPVVLLGHGLVTWGLLRWSVPLESMHDIVGAPVLGWPWEWELIARYLALHVALMLQVVGSVVLVTVALSPARLNSLLIWLIWVMFLAWPLHTIVVVEAATDNLTELMRGGGSFIGSMLLASGFLLVSLSASLLSVSSLLGSRGLKLALISVTTAIVSYWAFSLGTEAYIVKYGQVFSAFQFLLSTDRAHYASDGVVVLRYTFAVLAFVVTAAALQRYAWMYWIRLGTRRTDLT